MGLSFRTGLSIRVFGAAAPRRTTAIVASFAVLFQALALGWHHHELPFASRGSPVGAVAATGSETPASVDRDCPICFALAHHSAVPLDLVATAPPAGRMLRQVAPAPISHFLAPYLLFRSRAPPRV